MLLTVGYRNTLHEQHGLHITFSCATQYRVDLLYRARLSLRKLERCQTEQVSRGSPAVCVIQLLTTNLHEDHCCSSMIVLLTASR